MVTGRPGPGAATGAETSSLFSPPGADGRRHLPTLAFGVVSGTAVRLRLLLREGRSSPLTPRPDRRHRRRHQMVQPEPPCTLR